LGVSYNSLINLIRHDKLKPVPMRDSSGDYLWSESDLRRARQIYAMRPPRKAVQRA
jgi:hypothetical protein